MTKRKPVTMIVIPHDRHKPTYTITVEADKTGEAISREVGGFFDVVRLPDNYDLWVNDEGLIEKLPLNVRACLLVARLWDEDPKNIVLVGNAVLAKSDKGGHTVSVPEEMAEVWNDAERREDNAAEHLEALGDE